MLPPHIAAVEEGVRLHELFRGKRAVLPLPLPDGALRFAGSLNPLGRKVLYMSTFFPSKSSGCKEWG